MLILILLIIFAPFSLLDILDKSGTSSSIPQKSRKEGSFREVRQRMRKEENEQIYIIYISIYEQVHVFILNQVAH